MNGEESGLMMKYFVLKPRGDDVYAKASRRAMLAYAAVIGPDNPLFSQELRDWALAERLRVIKVLEEKP